MPLALLVPLAFFFQKTKQEKNPFRLYPLNSRLPPVQTHYRRPPSDRLRPKVRDRGVLLGERLPLRALEVSAQLSVVVEAVEVGGKERCGALWFLGTSSVFYWSSRGFPRGGSLDFPAIRSKTT